MPTSASMPWKSACMARCSLPVAESWSWPHLQPSERVKLSAPIWLQMVTYGMDWPILNVCL